MRSDVHITVECDNCPEEVTVDGYNEKQVGAQLEREGWFVEDGKDYCCPDCYESGREK